MAISLQTNDDDKVMTISDVTLNGFVLFVDHSDFSAKNTFSHHDTNYIKIFIKDLESIQQANHGAAELIDAEGNELCFKLNRLGHLEITGTLVKYIPLKQELNFGFETDQTCLGPFINDLTLAMNNL